VEEDAAGQPRRIVGIDLESVAGETLVRFPWRQGESPAELFARIGDELKRRSIYPGDDSFDSSRIMETLVNVVRTAMDVRERGIVESPVVEVINHQWALTDEALECLELFYSIGEGQMFSDQVEWETHMHQKTRIDREAFDEAYRVARAFFEMRRRPSLYGGGPEVVT